MLYLGTEATLPCCCAVISSMYIFFFFFFLVLWGYWHCGHSWPIVPTSGDSEDDCGEADGIDRGNRSSRRKPAPTPLLSITKSHMTRPGFEPGPPWWEMHILIHLGPFVYTFLSMSLSPIMCTFLSKCIRGFHSSVRSLVMAAGFSWT
jgi:hypothetical protein